MLSNITTATTSSLSIYCITNQAITESQSQLPKHRNRNAYIENLEDIRCKIPLLFLPSSCSRRGAVHLAPVSLWRLERAAAESCWAVAGGRHAGTRAAGRPAAAGGRHSRCWAAVRACGCQAVWAWPTGQVRRL